MCNHQVDIRLPLIVYPQRVPTVAEVSIPRLPRVVQIQRIFQEILDNIDENDILFPVKLVHIQVALIHINFHDYLSIPLEKPKQLTRVEIGLEVRHDIVLNVFGNCPYDGVLDRVPSKEPRITLITRVIACNYLSSGFDLF